MPLQIIKEITPFYFSGKVGRNKRPGSRLKYNLDSKNVCCSVVLCIFSLTVCTGHLDNSNLYHHIYRIGPIWGSQLFVYTVNTNCEFDVEQEFYH